ncbi:MAG: methyltransferase domain-containing protein [Pyrinomonadaceae bacterium]
MDQKLLEIIVCSKCTGDLKCEVEQGVGDDILDAKLTCVSCDSVFPVTNGIPRFIEQDNYASSFGYQWNLFRKEQIDSHNGTTLSADRLWSETKWTKDELKGKWILDAGCGAGRFLDAVSQSEAQIIGLDISSAIDAAKANLEGRENVHFVQASIYEMPFRAGTFDFGYCIGVIQHTPDPEKSIRSVAKMVKDGGKIAVTIYGREHWYTKLHSKYLLRPFTKRMKKETLLGLIRFVMPVVFPVTNVLFKIPVLGRFFAFGIPVANYVNEKQLSNDDLRYSWAVLDTFDMLSPHFDQPMTEAEASKALNDEGVRDITRQPLGLNLIGSRSIGRSS